ncbi:MAG: hypothetical protein AAGF47_02855 [Planctomycetota bacterium]
MGVLTAHAIPGQPLFGSGNIWLVLGFTAAGAVLLPEFLFPTWVRVVPGRIDLIRDSLFGRGFVGVTQLDLRTNPVLITKNAVIIEPTEIEAETDPGTAGVATARRGAARSHTELPHAISLLGTLRRRSLVDTIVRACVSEVDPPELPDGHLVG